MRLYEYEAKNIFKKHGIPVPEGYVISSVDEILPNIRKKLVIKSQVLIGARGKAGGIKFAEDITELKNNAKDLLGKKIHGFTVKKLLIEEKVDIDKELYAGITFNKSSGKIIVIFSTYGGMEIEEVAKNNPEAIIKQEIDILDGWDIDSAKNFLSLSQLENDLISQLSNIFLKLYEIFIKYDAEIVEINPLVITKQKRVVACDARMSIYDDAIPKQIKSIPELNREDGTLTDIEKEAKRYGLGYIEMDGEIGVIGNGAGLNLATLDMLRYVGLKPANFLEVSGRTYDKSEKGLEIVLKNPNVRIIFGNFFGCISRCDVIAEGLASAIKKGILPKDIPMIVAMRGNGGEEGSQTLKDIGIEVFEDDEQAIRKILELIKNEKPQNNTEFKPQNNTKFLYKDLTEKIIGCAFEVYKVLGYGFLEKVYKNSLISELRSNGIRVEEEYPIKVKYKMNIVGDYCADLFVERKVIVEIKSEEKYNSVHETQLLNYLKATGVRVGLLINFGKKKCEFKRLIF